MHLTFTLSTALLASVALAAPTKQKDKHVGHFAQAISGQRHKGPANPLAEMKHIFGKYDWSFDVDKFESNIPQLDIPAMTKGAGSKDKSGKDKAGLLGGSKVAGLPDITVDIPSSLPDLLDDIGNTLGSILGGGDDGYGEPQTTLTKVVKPTTSKAKKPAQTGTSVRPVVTASSYVAPSPPASYTPESSSVAPVVTSAAPVTSETPVVVSSASPSSEAPVVVSSASPSSEAPIVASSEAPAISYAAPSTSEAAVPSYAAPSTSEAPITSAPVSAPIETSSVASSTTSSAAVVSSEAAPSSTTPVTTYTPSFAFDPTTSVAVTSSAPLPSTTSVAVVSSAPPPSTTSAAPSSTKQTTGGKVTATPEQNESEYLSPVSVGGQTLNLNFDTGSADLWVFSSSLSDAQRSNHTAFDPSKSSTWQKADGYTWSIAYGDGSSAAGNVGYDTVVVGGATATRQAVEIATTVSDKFAKDVRNDGLVGLAFSSINTVNPQQQKTFFENIMPNLDQPLFTADLREDTETSTYEFGTIDASKYNGNIHYTPIDNSNGHWQFPSTTYTINGQSFTNANAAPAIADTGTSLILADQATVTAYYGAVSGATFNSQLGGYTYSCTATLPEFGVQLGSSGFTATIPGSKMTYAPLGNGDCFGGLQSNAGGNYQIFGDVLFKQYFAVFNGGEKKFGLAAKTT